MVIKFKFSKYIAMIVSLTGITVMIGWFFNVQILQSILPQSLPMKFFTAFCFFLSGIIFYFLVKDNEIKNDINKMIILFSGFIIFLIMTSFLISIFLNTRIGLNDLFVKENIDFVKTTVQGNPSLFSIINFILVLFFSLFNFVKIKFILQIKKIIALIITLLGILTVIGYLTNIPKFYGQFNNISTATTLNAAILFILLGIGFFIFSNYNNLSED